ncbi:hypothetical protein Pd630_LPD13077 (plasmid) [Rhodococcus opacus PD630]|nr:hypothetical protein Pd630_LPD13077 [Rhodococcus opacus PD630]
MRETKHREGFIDERTSYFNRHREVEIAPPPPDAVIVSPVPRSGRQ